MYGPRTLGQQEQFQICSPAATTQLLQLVLAVLSSCASPDRARRSRRKQSFRRDMSVQLRETLAVGHESDKQIDPIVRASAASAPSFTVGQAYFRLDGAHSYVVPPLPSSRGLKILCHVWTLQSLSWGSALSITTAQTNHSV